MTPLPRLVQEPRRGVCSERRHEKDNDVNNTADPDPQSSIESREEQIQSAMHVLARGLAPALRDLERAAATAWRSLLALAQAAPDSWRLRGMMPALTLRGVLVHGYVPWDVDGGSALAGGQITQRPQSDDIPVLLSPGMPAGEIVDYYGEDLALNLNRRGNTESS